MDRNVFLKKSFSQVYHGRSGLTPCHRVSGIDPLLGTGKTHIAPGLGLAACQKGLKVRSFTAAGLVMN